MSEVIKIDIRKLNPDQIKAEVIALGEPAFRAKQIYEWLWQKSAQTFDEMTNLSKNLRTHLNDKFQILAIKTDKIQKSSDGTIKSRFVLYDGHKIESVLIPVPEENRFTVCVSTQVGCSLTCKFCATGQMKRVRNLDGAEIYDQYVMVNQQCIEMYNHPLTNVVYMGMGEPLLAYSSTMESIALLTEPHGLNISPKRITVSTAGIAKMIKKLADDDVRFNLALSLHAADDLKRNEIMPINEQNNLEVLMESLVYFYEKTGNKISYEYIAFQNFNDSLADAKNLVKLCKSFPVKVNIIEYNPIDGVDFIKADEDKINLFARHLRHQDVMVTVRRSRGKDIDAACGQLANKE
ncbi:MAG: 23S rRNA (adenine(2503)-C(2))-methyltransferase RlmN [Saprospiraceae bacterium]|jgi:23S rRNA (adenine2503-C2)-methyltransferase|nr:23S rRNA (adenine(2503)-C(2))-methyltransferase RlmN [Saprospiraceae bacterium]MBL0026250.1 23S rRNA (adenine(2503)-C(2))-methyltransferase RlmN [Saprospiraceae bacterium]